MKSQFKPNKEMIIATQKVLMTMATVKIIKPIVDKYQQEYFDNFKPQNKRFPKDSLKTITKPCHSYFMDDKDFARYSKWCSEKQEKAGLITESKDHCPLLVAEEQQRQAERLLIKAMSPVIGKNAINKFYKEEHFQKAIELSLKLITPFIQSAY